MLTTGIVALTDLTRDAILAAVADFRDDADREHHVCTLSVEGHAVVWYILYHGRDHGERDFNPVDPATGRVLVVMLAGEP